MEALRGYDSQSPRPDRDSWQGVGAGETRGEESRTSSCHYIDFIECWLRANPVLNLCTDVSRHVWLQVLQEGEPRHGGANLFPFLLLTSSLPGSWGFVFNAFQCFSKCDSGAWGSLPICKK